MATNGQGASRCDKVITKQGVLCSSSTNTADFWEPAKKTHYVKPWEEQHCRHDKVFHIKIHIETKTQTDTQDVTKAHAIHTESCLPIKLKREKGWNERLEHK